MNEVKLTAKKIKEMLSCVTGYYVHIPEFTFNGLWRRIDLLRVDTKNRETIGFEIKVSKQDFRSDKKWTEYGGFCTKLSIVCPAGLVTKSEVADPYGLLWINPSGSYPFEWVKRPRKIEHENWKETYTKILEMELVRLHDRRHWK